MTAAVVCAWLACAPVNAQDVDVRTAVVAADDARIGTAADRALVTRALANTDAGVRVMATRAIGRTRRAEFLDAAVARLADASIDVRREAAFAIAHIGAGDESALVPATTALLDALSKERDPLVLGALAEEVGRLPVVGADNVGRIARALAAHRDGPPPARLGVARGAEALARRAARLTIASDALEALLDALYTSAADRNDALSARVRRLAVTGRTAANAIADPDAQVRRLAVIALARQPVSLATARTWLADASPLVRHAVVTRVGAQHAALAETALADANVNVRLAAIDVLGAQQAWRRAVPDLDAAAWHEHAHALVAAARTDASAAAPVIGRSATSSVWQVRMYAARAAGHARMHAVLAALLADAHVNVRHAALVAWKEAKLDGLVDAAVQSLETDDGQLALEAAHSLEGAASTPRIVEALRTALRRFSTDGRDTSRDPREALTERVRELDPEAEVTLRAIGAPRTAPRPVPPTWSEIEALEARQVVFRMSRNRSLTVRLYPRNAPTAVARFVSQVQAGEWNGRTFHRVEPGFVLQGGSPMANEYAGAPAYTRDEFSAMSHVRGTIGISTRGADTGDGQIFVNLVDNGRLDFGFTLIGAVTPSDAVLDEVLEGDVIESAVVVAAPRP